MESNGKSLMCLEQESERIKSKSCCSSEITRACHRPISELATVIGSGKQN